MDFDIRRKITNLIARYEAEEITYSELSNFVANIAEHGNAESYLFVAHVLNELPSPLSQRLAKEVSSRAKQIDRVWKGIEANQDKSPLKAGSKVRVVVQLLSGDNNVYDGTFARFFAWKNGLTAVEISLDSPAFFGKTCTNSIVLTHIYFDNWELGEPVMIWVNLDEGADAVKSWPEDSHEGYIVWHYMAYVFALDPPEVYLESTGDYLIRGSCPIARISHLVAHVGQAAGQLGAYLELIHAPGDLLEGAFIDALGQRFCIERTCHGRIWQARLLRKNPDNP